MDKITLERIQKLHPALRAEARKIYDEICAAMTNKNVICRFAYTLRTFEEQAKLYAQGRSAKGPVVTNAGPGKSNHNYGLAIDIVLLKDTDNNGSFETASWETKTDFDLDTLPDWMECVKIFKKYGWAWGGDWHFKDMPHFEKTMGRSIDMLQGLHKGRRFDGEGYVILN